MVALTRMRAMRSAARQTLRMGRAVFQHSHALYHASAVVVMAIPLTARHHDTTPCPW